MKISIKLIVFLAVFFASTAYSQDNAVSNDFPLKVTGYFGIVHPIATLQKGEVKMNFDEAYTVGIPVGINVQKSPKMGYSFEIVPTIKTDKQESKVSSIAIQPALFFPLRNGWTVVSRLSFETSGRYGFIPVLSKVIYRGKNPVSFVLPFPVKFGNNEPVSFGTAFLVTISI